MLRESENAAVRAKRALELGAMLPSIPKGTGNPKTQAPKPSLGTRQTQIAPLLTFDEQAWDDELNSLRREALVSYQFDFDPIHRIARFRLEGHISDEDLREYYAAATRFAALTNPAGGLFDASGITSFDVSPKVVNELASLPPNIADQSAPRVVIAPAPAVYGMARMFEILGERTRPNLHIVHTEREALAILGVVNPRFEPFPE